MAARAQPYKYSVYFTEDEIIEFMNNTGRDRASAARTLRARSIEAAQMQSHEPPRVYATNCVTLKKSVSGWVEIDENELDNPGSHDPI